MIRLIALLLLFSGNIYAANQDSLIIETQPNIQEKLQQSGHNGGQVKVVSNSSIDHLLNLHVQLNKKHKTYSGYRIQIYSGSSNAASIEQLKQMRDDFEKEFPDMPAYLKYFDPDFKIRVGNFRTRLECIPALHRIKKKFPASYPVKTDITLEDMKRLPLQDRPLENEELLTPLK